MSLPKKRGPYGQYLLKNTDAKVPRRTKYALKKKIIKGDSDESSSSDNEIFSPPENIPPHTSLSETLCKNQNSSVLSDSSDSELSTIANATENDKILCNLRNEIPGSSSDIVATNVFSDHDDENLIEETFSHLSDDPDQDFMSPVNEPSSPDSQDQFFESDDQAEVSDNENIDEKSSPEDLLSKYSEEVLLRTLLLLGGKIRHNLTYSAAEDYAKLIDIQAKKKIRYTSKYHTQNIVNALSISIQVHHFCPSCSAYAGIEKNSIDDIGTNRTFKCKECQNIINISENREAGNIFMHLPLTEQLKHYFERNHTDNLYPNSRTKQNRFNIENIFDTNLYKKLVPDISSNSMISVNFSVDGTPLFKSSQTSITPILCSINELHPKQQRQQTMLVSIYLGTKKPDMNEYIKPFVNETQSLASEGFTYVYNGNVYTKKCKVLVGVVDSVERPELRCTTSFRGRYGCGLCLHEGIEVPKGRGYVRVYPIDENDNAWGEGLRDHEATINHAELLIKGVKRRSTLCDIPGFDIITGLCVDWMHSVSLGVCRQLAALWFDSSNHGEKFYFQRFLSEIDDYLISIKPSSDASRTPRKMSERKHWKAHEWVLWLLFYSLAVMKKLFPKEYVQHWSLLVDATSTLLQTSISTTEIYNAQRQLFQFVKGVEILYGIKHVSFNVHLLTHLAQSCLHWGPLWTHSAFRYEDYHQELKSFVNSCNAANLQILHSFQAKFAFQKLYDMYYNKLNFAEREWLDELLNKKKYPAATMIINNLSLYGKPKVFETIPKDDYLALKRLNISLDDKSLTKYFKRIMMNKEIIVSRDYDKMKKRNNFTVLLMNGQVFEINHFIVIEEQSLQTCYALGEYFEKQTNKLFPGKTLKHMTFVKKCNSYAAVNVQEIKNKVIIVRIPSDGSLFIACTHPNRYEMLN